MMKLSTFLHVVDREQFILIDNLSDLDLPEEELSDLKEFDYFSGYCRLPITLESMLSISDYYVTKFESFSDVKGVLTSIENVSYISLVLKRIRKVKL